MIDEGIKAGMNHVDSISFDLDPNEKEAYQEALMVEAL
jgi:uncharacterized protein YggE